MFRRTLQISRFIHRRYENILQEKKAASSTLLSDTIQRAVITSPADWHDVRDQILRESDSRSQLSNTTIDAMTIGACTSLKKYDLAFSYVDYLKSQSIKLNLASIGKLFKLIYEKNFDKQISKKDEDFVQMLYDSVRSSYPVLDHLTLESIIQAVSITKNWKLCTELLNEIRKTAIPSAFSYCATISAYFRNNVDNLAWEMLLEMLENDRIPHGSVFKAYLKKLDSRNPIEKKEILEKMLKFIQDSNLVLDREGASAFLRYSQETKITNRGICLCCKNKLKNFVLTETDFKTLKEKVLNNVIVGKNVFNKSTPAELENFKNFIKTMGQFDVVIDGLNVAYSVGVKQSPLVTSGLVAAVVSHFASQDLKILVLGRNHMNKWPRKNLGYIQQNATLFLTENLSHDDPYLLYCALNSGQNTIIVSRDLMRSHKFLLGDFHEKFLFDRWLHQRQYQLIRVKENGEPIFRYPPLFSQVAQKTSQNWHIPFVDLPRTRISKINWLCLKVET